MTDPTEFWCSIEGKHYPFIVSISLNRKIANLKTEIYNVTSNSLVGYNAPELTLTKVCYIMISM